MVRRLGGVEMLMLLLIPTSRYNVKRHDRIGRWNTINLFAQENLGKSPLLGRQITEAFPWDTAVPAVNSIPLAQSRESGDAPTYGGFAQTDLVGGHRAL